MKHLEKKYVSKLDAIHQFIILEDKHAKSLSVEKFWHMFFLCWHFGAFFQTCIVLFLKNKSCLS